MRRNCLIILSFICGFALQAQEYQLSKPVIRVEGGTFFEKKATAILGFRLEGAEIRFSLDGSVPTENSPLYKHPISVKRSSTLKVKAFNSGFKPSETVSIELVKLGRKIKSIELSPKPSRSYPGEGGQTLIDRGSGSMNFRDGNWLGYNEGPITLTIDLGKKKSIQEVVLSTLSSSGSWIMPPKSIKSSFSSDGKTFEEGQTLQIIPLDGHKPGSKQYYPVKNESGKVRYIRLVVEPLKELPDWHPGKGNPAWVFLDEIIIN